jgi:hypothetical protein
MMTGIKYLFFILAYLYCLILEQNILTNKNIITYFSDTQPDFLNTLLEIDHPDPDFSFSIYKLILKINVSNLYLLRNYNIFNSNIRNKLQIENNANNENINKIIKENMRPITTNLQLVPILRKYKKTDIHHYNKINQTLVYVYLGAIFISIKICNSIQHH